MKTPIYVKTDYPATQDAWQRGMERIRAMAPWQRSLIAPELVEEALYGETEVIIVV